MKKILIQVQGLGEGKLFNPDERDSSLEPMIYLRDRLKQCGYQLETVDDKRVEDCSPMLPDEEFYANMIVKPLPRKRG